MSHWKPRHWPLTPSVACWYSCVDARRLDRLEHLPGVVGLRITGPFVSVGNGLALVDTSLRTPKLGRSGRVTQIVLARLPARLATLAGFPGGATVVRYCAPDEQGCLLYPFSSGRGEPVKASLLVRHADLQAVILGTVIGTLDSCSDAWSTWHQVEQRLTRGLAAKSPAHLTLEAHSFVQLRDKVTAAARVYGNIEAPADLLMLVSPDEPPVRDLTSIGWDSFIKAADWLVEAGGRLVRLDRDGDAILTNEEIAEQITATASQAPKRYRVALLTLAAKLEEDDQGGQ